MISKNSVLMSLKNPEPDPRSHGRALAARAGFSPEEEKGNYPLIILCLLLGPLGMMYLDWKHGFLGLTTWALYWVGTFIAWPPLMVIFLVVGLPLCAYRAHRWINGEVGLYKKVFFSGFKSLFDPVPFFLPLIFDLSMLVLLECLLRQVWLNRQRGSVMAALAIACVSTPIIMLGVRAIGKSLIRRALLPFLLEADAINYNR